MVRQMKLDPVAGGWRLNVSGVSNDLMFLSGACAEAAALRLVPCCPMISASICTIPRTAPFLRLSIAHGAPAAFASRTPNGWPSG